MTEPPEPGPEPRAIKGLVSPRGSASPITLMLSFPFFCGEYTDKRYAGGGGEEERKPGQNTG